MYVKINFIVRQNDVLRLASVHDNSFNHFGHFSSNLPLIRSLRSRFLLIRLCSLLS
jgi:hypothetical protein